MDVFISIVAVLIALSCLATLLFSDIKDRYKQVAANDNTAKRSDHGKSV